MFCAIWIICVVVQVLFVEGAALFQGGGTGQNKAFKTVALSGGEWALCLVCGVFSMLWYLVIAAAGRAMKPILVPAASEEAVVGAEPLPEVPNEVDKPSDPATNSLSPRRKNARFRKAVFSIIWANRLQASASKGGAVVQRSNSKSTISETSSRSGSRSLGDATRWHESRRNKSDRQIAKEYVRNELTLAQKKRNSVSIFGVRMHRYLSGEAYLKGSAQQAKQYTDL